RSSSSRRSPPARAASGSASPTPSALSDSSGTPQPATRGSPRDRNTRRRKHEEISTRGGARDAGGGRRVSGSPRVRRRVLVLGAGRPGRIDSGYGSVVQRRGTRRLPLRLAGREAVLHGVQPA